MTTIGEASLVSDCRRISRERSGTSGNQVDWIVWSGSFNRLSDNSQGLGSRTGLGGIEQIEHGGHRGYELVGERHGFGDDAQDDIGVVGVRVGAIVGSE